MSSSIFLGTTVAYLFPFPSGYCCSLRTESLLLSPQRGPTAYPPLIQLYHREILWNNRSWLSYRPFNWNRWRRRDRRFSSFVFFLTPSRRSELDGVSPSTKRASIKLPCMCMGQRQLGLYLLTSIFVY
ncbi:MAG: hypothetical protein CM15mV33_680 [uncultured marine virus]|nr:MAG: hypothetical protein CM15mV33_680 [uncultured marine virus]